MRPRPPRPRWGTPLAERRERFTPHMVASAGPGSPTSAGIEARHHRPRPRAGCGRRSPAAGPASDRPPLPRRSWWGACSVASWVPSPPASPTSALRPRGAPGTWRIPSSVIPAVSSATVRTAASSVEMASAERYLAEGRRPGRRRVAPPRSLTAAHKSFAAKPSSDQIAAWHPGAPSLPRQRNARGGHHHLLGEGHDRHRHR